MGNQFTTVDTEPEYIVQAYLDEAMKLSDEGDVGGALEALEDAKENSINMHVISAIEGKIKTLRQKAALQKPAEKVEKRKKKSSEGKKTSVPLQTSSKSQVTMTSRYKHTA